MRTKTHSLFISLALLAGYHQAAAEYVTAFSYQGQLQTGGSPANGLYDFQFSLFNEPSGGSQIGVTINAPAIGVTNGQFSTNLNFGAVFTGGATWLAISVCSNGVGSYVALSPLQQILPTPYAIFAPNAAYAANFTGPVALSQLPSILITNNEANLSLSNLTLSGPLALTPNVNSTATMFVNYDLLLSSDADNNFFCGLNAGNTEIAVNNSSGDFLITGNTGVGASALLNDQTGSDNTGLGSFALLYNEEGNDNAGLGAGSLAYNENGSQNTAIGEGALYYLGFHGQISSSKGGTNNIALGYEAGYNFTNAESYNIDIGSPGQANESSTIRLGTPGVQTNTVIAGVINGNGAGLTNLSATNLTGVIPASILPGFQESSLESVVGGGINNQIAATANQATIAGGYINIITSGANYSVIGGGAQNTNTGSYATLTGGYQSLAGGNYSVVAGYQNQALGISAVIGGGGDNVAGVSAENSVIAGGSDNNLTQQGANIGGGYSNTNTGEYATIGGGQSNRTVQTYDAVGGGLNNTASGGRSFVGGGTFNTAAYLFTTVAGGASNNASYYYDTVGGGVSNNTTNRQATVGGGIYNTAGGDSSTVPGGSNNLAGADFSFAAGANAQATNTGAFVWSDGSGASTVSTNTNSVTMRASGGFRFMTSDVGATTGEYLPAGGGGWVALSDRNSKENFQPVNSSEVLAKVAALPMSSWNYKTENASVRHIGPMAQDFKASFQVGETDTGICTVDEEGVALAAIQGLNAKINAKDAEIQDLKQSVADLKKMVQALAAKN